MRIADTRKINKKIEGHIGKEQMNALIGLALENPIDYGKYVFDSPAELKSAAEEIRKDMRRNGFTYTDDEAVILAMVLTILNDPDDPNDFGGLLDDDSDISGAILHEIARNSRIFHKEDMLDQNPYLQNIHFDHQTEGNIELTHNSYDKYEPFIYTTPSLYAGLTIPSIGAFDHKFEFPAIKEEENLWMSVSPSEIFTMEQPIRQASGRVLALGCGLGYFAYMMSEKGSVDSVTIAEKSPEVIRLFETFILPQFAHKDKIYVIEADALDYIKDLPDGTYDFCFADIWQGNTDVVPFMKMKHLCRKFKKMPVSYWIEDSMEITAVSDVFMLMLDEIYHENPDNSDLEDAPGDKTNESLDFLRELLKDINITRPEQVDEYLDFENILKLME